MTRDSDKMKIRRANGSYHWGTVDEAGELIEALDRDNERLRGLLREVRTVSSDRGIALIDAALAGHTAPTTGDSGSCEARLAEADDKLLSVAIKLGTTEARLAESVKIVRDLTRQITEFTEREGEADFYTGVAVEFLKKQSPCNHVWAKRLRGRDTCAVCGVARAADPTDAAP